MTNWISSIKEILNTIFAEFALRLAVFFISWVIVHKVLLLPNFGFLSDLNIPVINNYSIHSRLLLSLAVALLMQKAVYDFLHWIKERRDSAAHNKSAVGDMQPNEAVLLLVLYQERIGSFRLRHLDQTPEVGSVLRNFFKDADDVNRSLRRLTSTNFMYYDDGQYVAGGAYHGVHLDFIRNIESALISLADKLLPKAKELISKQS